MSAPEWTLYASNRSGQRQAQVDLYETCEIIGRHNDVSTWRLVLPSDCEVGRMMLADPPGVRLEVALDGVIWTSGPVTNLERTVDLDGDALEVHGADDTVWLARRLAHPQPGTAAPPYATTAYDVHTGEVTTVLAELADVNAGPSAVIARRVAGLTVPPPTPGGGAVTVSGRWQNLLALMQETARPAAVRFRIVDLRFIAEHQSTDPIAVFSEGLETLGGWTVTASAPTATKAIVAGQGEGTARVISEYAAAPSAWGLVETFVDRRDTDLWAELDHAGADALAQGAIPVTATFLPLDNDSQQFGRDWNLGDYVTVVAGDLTLVDQVSTVHVTLDAAGATVVPSVGPSTGDLALFRSLAGLDRRVRQLERV